MGIQPDAILCRADHEIGENERDKISLYCDVNPEAVIGLPTLASVYAVPLHLEAEGLGDILTKSLSLPDVRPNLESWRKIVSVDEGEHPEIDIAVVGKYVELKDLFLRISRSASKPIEQRSKGTLSQSDDGYLFPSQDRLSYS